MSKILPLTIDVERAARTRAALRHDARPGSYTLFGSAQVILVHPDTGLYHGATDSRRDGAALGW